MTSDYSELCSSTLSKHIDVRSSHRQNAQLLNASIAALVSPLGVEDIDNVWILFETPQKGKCISFSPSRLLVSGVSVDTPKEVAGHVESSQC